ncbi:MAG TPA: hypothetical protein VMW41_06730 [Candidatus Bathyarchaeia archaeon]|nr:hypothetical protein [Candidatus Bathyarchaeia archaeon]
MSTDCQAKNKDFFSLVFDLGTNNLKLAIFGQNGLVAAGRESVRSAVTNQKIEVAGLQEIFLRAIKKLWQTAGKPPLQVIGGVGIMHGLAIFNSRERQFKDCYIYSNLEAGNQSHRLKKISRTVYQKRGAPPSSAYGPEQAALRNKKGELSSCLLYPSTAVLLGPLSNLPLEITKPALSHLGFLDLQSLKLNQPMLKFASLSEDNFATISKDFIVGKLDSRLGKKLGFASPHGEILLMDLGGDGLIIHELIDNPKIGSFKIESTAVVRLETEKPVLEDINNGEIPVTWSYYHEPGRFIWGAATNAGVLTLVDYLPPGLNPSLDFYSLNRQLEKELLSKGIPSVSTIGIGLPFSRGERAPGWVGKRPTGIRGRKPKSLMWQLYLWQEAVAFNLNQVVGKMKEVARDRKIKFPKAFFMTGATNYWPTWAKLQALICQINLVKSEIEEPNLWGEANRILKYFGRPTFKAKKGRVYRPETSKYPNFKNLSERYQFYLREYQKI